MALTAMVVPFRHSWSSKWGYQWIWWRNFRSASN